MNKKNRRALYEIIASLILLLLAFFLPVNDYIKIPLYLLSYIVVAYRVLLKAFRNIIKGKVFDEFFLMSLATIVAICLQEYAEGVAVMIFYQVGELFQSIAVNNSRKSIEGLMNLYPETVCVLDNGLEVIKEPDEVNVSDIILVKPGEKIPLDGVILKGESSIDTSSLTGEAIPRDVIVGNEVFSGTLNLSGALTINVKKSIEESTVSKILALVEDATANKGEAENFISKFAKYYTPIVVILAIMLAVIPPLFTGFNFSEYIHRALSFLVISCPCALVISIPLGFFSGIGRGSKLGILIKGSTFIEKMAKANTVCFDKTGTLTTGKFEVLEIESRVKDEKELLQYAASLEKNSTHPIARAILNKNEFDLLEVEEGIEIPGYGLKGKINKKLYYVGNQRLMDQLNITDYPKDIDGTIIHIAKDDTYLGYIKIGDKIKDEANLALTELKQLGVKELVMLTGDRKSAAQSVQAILPIDHVEAELLPTDKVDNIKKYQNRLDHKKESLIYIGDGMNDAPSLALADVGMAMGGLGSDASIEASDVVIMTDQLNLIGEAIKLSRKTMWIVKENIVFAIGVKFLVLILSSFGLTSMFLAIFADVGVAVIAILNSMRNLYIRKRK